MHHRTTTLPPQFGEVGQKLLHVVKRTSNEYSSECLECGGVPHQSGELPDRCRWFDDGNPRGWCRRCGALFWPNNNNFKSDPEKMREWQEQREQAALREKARAETALSVLRREKIWLTYHEQMTEGIKKLWESWGIPEYWQMFWKLGYAPEHTVMAQGHKYISPTVTIPIFEAKTWNVLNIKHRLLSPPTPTDKYRPEKAGLPQSLYVAYPDIPIEGKTLIVEGEKKAMVSFITADDPFLQVVGIPGKSLRSDLTKKFEKCDPIYILLDPDAEREAHALGEALGKDRCRIIELPDKVDDMIIKYKLDKQWMNNIIRQGVKL